MSGYESGYELQNETDFSWRRTAVSDGEAVTSPGSIFQSLATAKEDAVWSMIGPKVRDKHYDKRSYNIYHDHHISPPFITYSTNTTNQHNPINMLHRYIMEYNY